MGWHQRLSRPHCRRCRSRYRLWLRCRNLECQVRAGIVKFALPLDSHYTLAHRFPESQVQLCVGIGVQRGLATDRSRGDLSSAWAPKTEPCMGEFGHGDEFSEHLDDLRGQRNNRHGGGISTRYPRLISLPVFSPRRRLTRSAGCNLRPLNATARPGERSWPWSGMASTTLPPSLPQMQESLSALAQMSQSRVPSSCWYRQICTPS